MPHKAVAFAHWQSAFAQQCARVFGQDSGDVHEVKATVDEAGQELKKNSSDKMAPQHISKCQSTTSITMK